MYFQKTHYVPFNKSNIYILPYLINIYTIKCRWESPPSALSGGVSLPFSFFKSVLAKILMVTKLPAPFSVHEISSILAKIFMVTKLELVNQLKGLGSVLAKIHMVTKHGLANHLNLFSSVLAKIHMVTKPIV